ncbi:MAG: hypothetical protein QOF60_1701 [Actinomycetota bacterium]|nr:hypothetical protein [Actinomycetota bacterium]
MCAARHPGEVTLRHYEPGDERAIQAMFDDTFGRQGGAAAWAWRHVEAPTGSTNIRVLEASGQIVGHLAQVDFATFIGGGRGIVRQGGDLMLLPEFRGHGLASMFGRDSIDDVGFDVKLSFPTDAVVERFRRNEEPSQLVVAPKLPEWVRWLRPLAAARNASTWPERVAAPAVVVGLAARHAITKGRGVGVVVADAPDVTTEFDDLAERSAAWAGCIRVRDAAYVRWRWLDNPLGQWTLATARRDGRLVGWVVFGARHDGDPSVGRIVDALAEDEIVLGRLLGHVTERFRRRRATHVAFAMRDPRPWAAQACRGAGFLERGVGPNVVLRRFAPKRAALTADPASWYLTLGDSDLA